MLVTNLWLLLLLESVSLCRTGLACLFKGNILIFPTTCGLFSPFLHFITSLGSHALQTPVGVCCWSRELIRVHAIVILFGRQRAAGAVGTLQLLGSLASPSPPALKGLVISKPADQEPPEPSVELSVPRPTARAASCPLLSCPWTLNQ